MDYFNAQSYCHSVGGYLAEPKSDDEMDVLRVIIQETGPRNNWWIGTSQGKAEREGVENLVLFLGARLVKSKVVPCVSGESSQPAHYDWKNSQTKIKAGGQKMESLAQCVKPYQLDKEHPIQETGGFIWPRSGKLIHQGTF